jgi:hypothetical protein
MQPTGCLRKIVRIKVVCQKKMKHRLVCIYISYIYIIYHIYISYIYISYIYIIYILIYIYIILICILHYGIYYTYI